ncbi:MAG: M48 family metallopeptidase [Gammaproteobacteria bacterium]|nr:M48 family metallopeptidase [Gammaproteobacteria bacterium]
MIELHGLWYPLSSSSQAAARLKLEEDHFHLQMEGQIDQQGALAGLQFSQRVGNIPRHITFADGSVFVCNTNDAIDQWLSTSIYAGNEYHWLHALESRWHWVAASIVIVVIFGFGFIWKGLPWISTEIAKSLPADIYQELGAGTLESFDELLLSKTELPEQRQADIVTRFEKLRSLVKAEEYLFELHFRKMSGVPNAFALPSGDIVITDALIELAEHDEEIESVLLHEIAHVVRRHGLQQIIHSSAISIIVSLILGDATAISNIAIALPAFLLESSYSRDHETEADEYALNQMLKAEIDPIHFANMMRKFMQYESMGDANTTPNQNSDATDEIFNYLSSHPTSSKRIEYAEEFARKFKDSRVLTD